LSLSSFLYFLPLPIFFGVARSSLAPSYSLSDETSPSSMSGLVSFLGGDFHCSSSSSSEWVSLTSGVGFSRASSIGDFSCVFSSVVFSTGSRASILKVFYDLVSDLFPGSLGCVGVVFSFLEPLVLELDLPFLGCCQPSPLSFSMFGFLGQFL
jgi:hypothetical protein